MRIAVALLFMRLLPAPAQTAAGADFAALAAEANRARDANRLDEALGLYRKALRLQPDWAEGWWSVGTLLYDRDAYPEAAAALEKAAKLSPKSGMAQVMLGLSEARLGRNREALRHITAGRELGIGNNPELRKVALYTEGKLLVETGEFGRAQETLGLLARDGLEEDELIVALGQAVLGVKSLEGADQPTRDLVRRAGWAEHFAARNELPAATREYDSLVAAAPNVRDVQFAYGRFLLANHENARAVEAFEREIENTPNHLLARLGIAGIYLVNNPSAGLPYAEQAVKLAPHLAEAHYLLGMLLLDTGKAPRAIVELEAARAAQPDEPKIHFALARAYAAVHRTEDAARARAAFSRLSRGQTASSDDLRR